MADGGNNNGQVVDQVVDIDRWSSSLTRLLDDMPQYMCSPGHPGRIGRIPENLREIDVKSYEPSFISIGPYHHGKPAVQPMERSKWMVLKYCLQVKTEVTLKDYLNEFKSIEPLARSFYSDVEMESEQFVQMLLLDSLYIVTTFCGMPHPHPASPRIESIMDNDMFERENQMNDNENTHMMLGTDERSDETFRGEIGLTRLFSNLFEHDLFLIENQLPFFVLQKAYVLTYGGSETQFADIMKVNFSRRPSGYTILDSEVLISTTEEVHHFLHLLNLFFRPMLQHNSISCELPESRQMFRLGSAMQLHEAGVNFEVRSSLTQHSLLDITLDSSGKMTMPCLHVDDNTGSVLRNLIALEQMKYPRMGLEVSAYAVLLLHLVTTPEDAELLRRRGILEHHLASDKEMMYFINRLSVGLSFDYAEDNYSLKHVFHELKKYTEHRRPRWKAWLKHRYFMNPWTTVSLLAASILLLFSVVQTYITVCSYYRTCFRGHL